MRLGLVGAAMARSVRIYDKSPLPFEPAPIDDKYIPKRRVSHPGDKMQNRDARLSEFRIVRVGSAYKERESKIG